MRSIMIVGTGSNVGKTTIVAGLCRVLANRGLRVAPFKSQNMSLNSYVTLDGGEIARSTALQAMAARQSPSIHMNPLLLKPKSDTLSQLIVHGQAHADVSAEDFFLSDKFQSLKDEVITHSLGELQKNYDVVIAEGAGSCAEPNFRHGDLVNMGLAHRMDADAFLLADIDQGGVFAEFLGTLAVLDELAPEDRSRICGFLINRFRGDLKVLQPAIDFVERHTQIPVVAVLPFVQPLDLDEEDRVRLVSCRNPEIRISIVHLPRISNSTDFQTLINETNVEVQFVRPGETLGRPDAIIIPGTRNAIEDLSRLRQTGMAEALCDFSRSIPVIGVCGGFEILGHKLYDPEGLESSSGCTPGLGVLDCDFTFMNPKVLSRRSYRAAAQNPFAVDKEIEGYEIHCGRLTRSACTPAFHSASGPDGAIHPDGLVMGTWIHDLFNDGPFVRTFVNKLREKKGLPKIDQPTKDRHQLREESLERLAAELEAHWPLRIGS